MELDIERGTAISAVINLWVSLFSLSYILRHFTLFGRYLLVYRAVRWGKTLRGVKTITGSTITFFTNFHLKNFGLYHLLLPIIEIRLATAWMVRGSNPGGGEIFHTRPDRPWGPPSLLYNGYRVFLVGKAPGAWR